MRILETGSLTALNNTVTADGLDSNASVGVVISGTWVGTATFQGSLDGINFDDIFALSLNGIFTKSTTVNGSFIINPAGLKSFRVKKTAYTSGTSTVTIQLGGPGALVNSLSTVVGNSDGTKIGNTGDRLKVDANITTIQSGALGAFTSKVRADILQDDIAINSLTVYNTIYSYSGTGLLIGFSIEFNNTQIVVKLIVDGETIFDGVDLGTLNAFLVTADAQYRRQQGTGIITQSSSLDWSLKSPMTFNSNVTISARASGGSLFTKNFQQGIVYIAKVT